MNAPDTFGMLLGSGITIMLAVQVILNVMVVTSLMPPTGIILPFVSWGGNALLIFMGCMGIMLNISRHIPK
jgi:cell division protein FtsW